MQDAPLVSVLVAVLDPDPAYLQAALRSVLAQSLSRIEVIVIEDPGPRSASEVIAGLGDPRIRYLRNAERVSLGHAKNRGLAEARADLVAMQDADDIAEPQRLEKQLEFLRANPAIGVLGSQIEVIDSRGDRLGYRRYPRDNDAIVRAMRRYNPIAHPAVMLRRALVLANGGYATERNAIEDYDLWCRLALRGVRFANHPEPLLRYRIHAAASTRSRVRQTIRGTLAIKRRYWAESMNAGDKVRMALEYALLGLPAGLALGLFLRTQISPTLQP